MVGRSKLIEVSVGDRLDDPAVLFRGAQLAGNRDRPRKGGLMKA